MTSHNSPAVFISSTLWDLRDLRAGIAYVLRSQDFIVNVSESADFEIRGDRSALEECFENVRTSDHYILLIGPSRGYEFKAGASATRQEFRTAREQFLKTGKPRMFLYIREGIQEELKRNKENRPVDRIDDLEHLRSSVEEVMQPSGPDAPNFLVSFSGFDQVMNSLAGRLNLGRNISETLARQVLLFELTANISNMLERQTRGAWPSHWSMSQVRKGISLQDYDLLSRIGSSGEHRTALVLALTGRIRQDNFRIKAIEDALQRGLFMQFDPKESEFLETATHRQLQQTLGDIRGLDQIDPLTGRSDPWDVNLILDLGSEKQVDAMWNVRGEYLLYSQAYFDRMENILNGHLVTCRVLLGMPENPRPASRRPVTSLGSSEEQKIRAEKVSPSEARRLIMNDIWPLGSRISADAFGDTQEVQIQSVATMILKMATDAGIGTTNLPQDVLDRVERSALETHFAPSDEGLPDLRVQEEK